MKLVEKIISSKAFERFRRNLALRTGTSVTLRRLSPDTSDDLRTVRLLKHFQIDAVIDVGANTGQFAEALFDFGFEGKVISFEPGSVAHQALLQRSAKHKNWVVAERCALGNTNTTTSIHISESSVFSSIKKIKDEIATGTSSAVAYSEQVPVYKLDDIVDQYIPDPKTRIFLKIDTQGYEKEVLEGAPLLLARAKGLKIEIPLHTLYSAIEWDFYQYLQFVQANGFYPYSFDRVYTDKKTGKVHEVDGIFFREVLVR